MKDRAHDRLQQLQSEYEAGQKMLADLDAKRQSLMTTLLRIEGAMQVLQELVQQGDAEPANGKSQPQLQSEPRPQPQLAD